MYLEVYFGFGILNGYPNICSNFNSIIVLLCSGVSIKLRMSLNYIQHQQQTLAWVCLHSRHHGHESSLFAVNLLSLFHLLFATLTKDVVDFSRTL